jgi:hypothetical protein
MEWQPGQDDGKGGTPDPGPSLPGGHEIPSKPRVPGGEGLLSPDPRLAGFAKGGEWDACPPSAALAATLEAVSGPGWHCPDASRDEMFDLLRQWQALESWAAAGKLGVLRSLIRDDAQPLPGGGYHGDLPDGWTKSLTHEVALALAMPAVSADKLMWLAWNLQALLPGTGDLLAGGDLTLAKARAVDQALNLLSDQDAARAEAMIVPDLPGKTYGQVQKLAVQAALTVDPESATRRREDAEQRKSRVEMFREESGAAALSGRDLPTDQTLAAHASVCARAQQYKDSAAFPDDIRMDQYRAVAYLDLLNGITTATRIAAGQLATGDRTAEHADEPGAGDDFPPESDPGDDEPDSGPSTNDPGEGPGGENPDNGPASPVGPLPASRLVDLVLPLATLLGLAERPGEGRGLGLLDPGLCRELAIATAGSPWTQLCVTVTNTDGIAIGHGCARLPRRPKTTAPAHAERAHCLPTSAWTPLPLPARVNLTITAARLAELTSTTGPPGQAPWSFTPDNSPGPPAREPSPPGDFGSWTLTLPDGRNLTVRLDQVPTFTCDHRHESHAYQPNDTLRHLVQVRDGDCTFPPCSRPARDSDFEHAAPYDKGGRTCACNAGARSRACHQIKQSPGWNVTQPRPGWHQWQTPSGRIYRQGPKHYPA